MHLYTVRFWYHTDLRGHSHVIAANYVQALALGLADKKIDGWPADEGFRVEILPGHV